MRRANYVRDDCRRRSVWQGRNSQRTYLKVTGWGTTNASTKEEYAGTDWRVQSLPTPPVRERQSGRLRRVGGITFPGLLLRSAVDEAGDVRLELGKILVAQVHHVSRIVILQVDIFLEFFRQAQMLHRVFRGVERRR